MRAKFICDSVTNNRYPGQEAKLSAVMGQEGENKDFNEATPAANLSIMIDNPKAKDYFKPGKEYYLDFSEAE